MRCGIVALGGKICREQQEKKAGLCKKVEDYKYSSFNEYLTKSNFIDTDYVFSILPKDAFVEYNNQQSSANCLDVEEKAIKRVTDEEARKIIKKYSKCESITEFQALSVGKRDKYLKMFKEKGVSIRQISRLTGVSYYIVQKI